MKQILFVLIGCMIQFTLSAQSPKFTKIVNTNAGVQSLYQLCNNSSDLGKFVNVDLVKLICPLSYQNKWPSGIDSHNDYLAGAYIKLKDYNCYYLADLPNTQYLQNIIVLWVPMVENQHMPIEMRNRTDFFIVIKKENCIMGDKVSLLDGMPTANLMLSKLFLGDAEKSYLNQKPSYEDSIKIAKIMAQKRAMYPNFLNENFDNELGVMGEVFVNYGVVQPTKAEQEAIVFYGAGKVEEAVLAFSEIRKTSPNNVYAIRALAKLMEIKGDKKIAYELLGEALKINKTEPHLLIDRARIANDLKFYDEALSLMDQLLLQNPTMDFVHIIRGDALWGKADFEKAISAYTKVIIAEPAMIVAYRRRANLLLYLKRYSEAVSDYTRLIKYNDKSSTTYNVRGVSYDNSGELTLAISDYTKSISLAPNNYIALCNRGFAYLKRKNTASAKSDFERSIEFNSMYADAYYGMANVSIEEEQFDAALPWFEKAIAADPKSEHYLQVYAETLLKLKKYNNILTIAEKQMSLNINNVSGWENKAFAQYQLKNFKAALQTLDAAILKFPNYADLYSSRSVVFLELGNKSAADADDAKAKQLGGK